MNLVVEKARTIPELYRNIADKMNVTDNMVKSYDCTKVNVSHEVFDHLEAAFNEEHPNADREQFPMLWVAYGPKAIEQLSGWEVEVEDGFIEFNVEAGDGFVGGII